MSAQASSRRKLVVYPYNLGSGSARHLAGELSSKCVRPNGSYKWFPNHIVVNWGNSQHPTWATVACLQAMLNKPQNVANASDKVKTFKTLQVTMGQYLPDWTTSRTTAAGWLSQAKYGSKLNAVVCRTLTRANSGRGIVLATSSDAIVAAPLYTRYKPKTSEFRIHVNRRFGIIDGVEKRRKNGVEESDGCKYIRSHDNGWVFCREGLVVPEIVKEAAMAATANMDLDFAAVDIGYHPEYGVAIYELNTAPGIEGQTLGNYVNCFRRYL